MVHVAQIGPDQSRDHDITIFLSGCVRNDQGRQWRDWIYHTLIEEIEENIEFDNVELSIGLISPINENMDWEDDSIFSNQEKIKWETESIERSDIFFCYIPEIQDCRQAVNEILYRQMSWRDGVYEHHFRFTNKPYRFDAKSILCIDPKHWSYAYLRMLQERYGEIDEDLGIDGYPQSFAPFADYFETKYYNGLKRLVNTTTKMLRSAEAYSYAKSA
tara:strand:+ start:834 stop:1484 length:651 start_codon:yes stop_codon:yes gene_type:complete